MLRRSTLMRFIADTIRFTDLVLGKHGRDKVGHTFLTEACRIGCDLGLFGDQTVQASQRPLRVSQKKWDRVRAVTAWTLFNFQL